jgi:hypothetical protein
VSAIEQDGRTEGDAPGGGSALEVFFAALTLGLTSFGGPIAHLGYFERAYVERRKWLTHEAFAAIVALCQTLPGPASSQMRLSSVSPLPRRFSCSALRWLRHS